MKYALTQFTFIVQYAFGKLVYANCAICTD